MVRLPDLGPEEMTDAQRSLHARLSEGPRQGVRGPFPIWLRAPGFAERADALGLHCRFENGLSAAVNEAAILVTAVHWRSAFVFRSHAELGATAGLAHATMDAIRRSRDPETAAATIRIVCLFARTILSEKGVSDTIWERAIGLLGEAGTVELIGIIGYYGIVCMSITAAAPSAEDHTFFVPTEPQ